MKLPQMLVTCALLTIGAMLGSVRDQIEPTVEAAVIVTATPTMAPALAPALDPNDSPVDSPIDSQSVLEPTECECKLADLQAKYDALLAEQSKLRAASVTVSSGSTGGSTGKLAMPSVTTSHYQTVVTSNSYGSNGSTLHRTPVANVVRGTANVVSGTVATAAKVVAAPVANYRARWTYPGTIEQHMAEDHGVSVAGLSRSQLLAQHDAIHDTIGPVYQSQSPRPTYSSSSNCPGGVCPTAGSVSRPRLGIFPRLRR